MMRPNTFGDAADREGRRQRVAPSLAAVVVVVVAAVVAFASLPAPVGAFVTAFAPTPTALVGHARTTPPGPFGPADPRRRPRLRAFDPSLLGDVPHLADAASSAASMSSAVADSASMSSAVADTTAAAGVGSAAGSAAGSAVGSVLDSSWSLLTHAASSASEHHHHVPDYDASNPIEVLLHTPTPWSVGVMLCIVALLVAWEESVRSLREGLPEALMAVVDSMLAEMGGLGFIGLFLGTFVTGGALGGVVGELSERFLGEEEVLLETFEFLHTVFFEVGIGFFAMCGLTVFAVLTRIKKLSEISELALDTDGDGEVSLEEMADALDVETMVVDANGDGILDDDEITDALRASRMPTVLEELTFGDRERGAEALVVREKLIQDLGLPEDFKVEYYFERIFAHELEEIVELSPLTWLPLIPIIALDDTIDLSHEVISASSSNAAMSSGWFLATPWFFLPTLAVQCVCLAWGLVNFWKMTSIKNMLLPTLVRDGADDGPARLLPPRYEDEVLLAAFDSSPPPVSAVESALGCEPPTDDHERLFGAAGSSGPSLYRDSIKFHTWLCVAQIVFFGGQIVIRDAWALLNEPAAALLGNPPYVVPELSAYSFFVALSALQLALAPATFLNYCFATSVESMTRGWAVDEARRESREHAEREAEMEARATKEEERRRAREAATSGQAA